MKIVYASRALRDINDILAYINKRSPQGARSVSLAIEHAIRMCAINPHASGMTDEPGRVLAGDPRRASEEPSQNAQRLMLLD